MRAPNGRSRAAGPTAADGASLTGNRAIRRRDSTVPAWRLLCLLTLTSALAAATGLLWALSPLWQGVAVLPGMLVAVCLVLASVHDSQRGGGR